MVDVALDNTRELRTVHGALLALALPVLRQLHEIAPGIVALGARRTALRRLFAIARNALLDVGLQCALRTCFAWIRSHDGSPDSNDLIDTCLEGPKFCLDPVIVSPHARIGLTLLALRSPFQGCT